MLMKVLMISSSYPQNAEDWRVRFISDLVDALARREDIKLRLWAPPGDRPSSVMNHATDQESLWLKELMAQGGMAHVLRTKGVNGIFAAVKLLAMLRKAYLRPADADVFHVNWLQNALPLRSIKKPVVISVLGSDYGLLRLPFMVTLLRKVIKRRKCILSPNADWMVSELDKQFGDIAEIRPIPFGVRNMWFGIERKPPVQAKRKWIVVLRVTKKKIGSLFSWGEKLFNGEDELHLLGPMQEQIVIPDWVHYHGATHPAELRDVWFPQATGMITLSEHDEGRPQVMLEAMAAKLPIIASGIPAHRNMIEHQRTGWIAATREEFQAGLKWVSQDNVNIRLGIEAADWVRRTVGTWDDCAEKYFDVYQKLAGMER